MLHKYSKSYIQEKHNTSEISTVGEENIQINVYLTASQKDRILNEF